MVGAVVLGAVLGLVLGMLGAGGTILAVPALVYVLGLAPRSAVAASLVIVALGALSGLAGYARSGRVHWGTVVRFGSSGAVGSFGGAYVSQWVPGDRLLALLGLLMLVAAVLIARRPQGSAPSVPRGSRRAAYLGFGVGLLTGFFGVGGGFVIVPALTLGLGLPIRLAVGTSLTIIALNAMTALLGYSGTGSVEWSTTLLVAAGAVTGGMFGSRLAGVVPERALRRSLAGLVAFVALYLIFRSASSWLTLAAQSLEPVAFIWRGIGG